MIKHTHDPSKLNISTHGMDDAEDVAEFKKTGKKAGPKEEAREDKTGKEAKEKK